MFAGLRSGQRIATDDDSARSSHDSGGRTAAGGIDHGDHSARWARLCVYTRVHGAC